MAEVAHVFDGGEIISIGDLQEYSTVVKAAFDVHKDREQIRRGLWKEYPAGDQARQIKIKADRVEHMLRQVTPSSTDLSTQQVLEDGIISECYDIINYAIFTVRKLTGE